MAVGYVLGAAAGRARYEQLKRQATDLLQHPKVQQTMFDLAGQAKANTHRVPGPAAVWVDTATTRVQDRLTRPDASTERAEQVVPEVGL